MTKERDGLTFVSHYEQVKDKYENPEFWHESQQRMIKGFEAMGLEKVTLPSEGLKVQAYGPAAQKLDDFEKSVGEDFAWVIPKSLIEGANDSGFECKELLGVDLFAVDMNIQYNDNQDPVKERVVYFYAEIAGIDHTEEEDENSD